MRRLDCAATLLRLGGRADLVRKRRATRTGRTVRVDNEEVHVRDQAPLHRGNMVLLGGWGFEDFIEHLNSFVFSGLARTKERAPTACDTSVAMLVSSQR